MTVTLRPETQAFVDKEVRDGSFASADEVIEAAIALLQHHRAEAERLLNGINPDELNRLLAEGMADVRAGNFLDGEEVFRELQAMSAARRRRQ